MANLYFNAAVNSNWNTLGNWWLNEAGTTPATSLPGSGDSVFIQETVESNSGSVPAVANLTVTNNAASTGPIELTVTGTAIWHGGFLGTQLNGSATFRDGSTFGDLTVQPFGGVSPVITGDATFEDYTGFYLYTAEQTFTVGGDLKFYDYAKMNLYYPLADTIAGSIAFNDYSSVGYGVSTLGNASKTIVFNDDSQMGGSTYADVVFNDNALMAKPEYWFTTTALTLYWGETFGDAYFNGALPFRWVWEDNSNVSVFPGGNIGISNFEVASAAGMGYRARPTIHGTIHVSKESFNGVWTAHLGSTYTKLNIPHGINGSSILGVI